MKFQSGDVVYWVGRHRHSPYEYYVDYGIVDEEFSDAVCVDRLHISRNSLKGGLTTLNCL